MTRLLLTPDVQSASDMRSFVDPGVMVGPAAGQIGAYYFDEIVIVGAARIRIEIEASCIGISFDDWLATIACRLSRDGRTILI